MPHNKNLKLYFKYYLYSYKDSFLLLTLNLYCTKSSLIILLLHSIIFNLPIYYFGCVIKNVIFKKDKFIFIWYKIFYLPIFFIFCCLSLGFILRINYKNNHLMFRDMTYIVCFSMTYVPFLTILVLLIDLYVLLFISYYLHVHHYIC